MSLMETLFGDTDDSAQQAQIDANQSTRRLIQRQTKRARQDVRPLFSAARKNRKEGFQGALDILSKSVPQQVGAFQQGNLGAQEALLAGLPQIQAAILGGDIDLSALQAQQIDFDPRFLDQTLPDFIKPKVKPKEVVTDQGSARQLDIVPEATPLINPQGGQMPPEVIAALQQSLAGSGGQPQATPQGGGMSLEFIAALQRALAGSQSEQPINLPGQRTNTGGAIFQV